MDEGGAEENPFLDPSEGTFESKATVPLYPLREYGRIRGEHEGI